MYHFRSFSVAYLIAALATMVAMTYCSPIYDNYKKMRDRILSEDSERRIGGMLKLSPDEMIVNKIFMEEKKRMMESSRQNRTLYVPSISFYDSKALIDNSTLLKLIQRMPKGAALHLHDSSATSLDWFVKNATYRDHAYMCVNTDGFIYFKAFQNPPPNPDCEWKLVNDERAKSGNIDEFDLHLKRNLSLVVTDPLKTYPDNAQSWRRFATYFAQVEPLMFYAPVFRDFFWRTLEEFHADNVQYIELRGTLEGMYEVNGTTYDEDYAVHTYKKTMEEFVRMHPDFSGAKIIFSGLRNSGFDKIMAQVKTAMQLNQKYPDFMLGYDLVGNEAFFNPVFFYIDALLYPQSQNPPYKLPYFLHVGETNWQGTDTDNNMVDAILLNATRIGHGFALAKRPKLRELVKEKGIAVEVNPICNQMLRLVADLRNHPMASLMADNFPIVISSDDFAVWEALPLSHDIYMAFMDMSGEDADLTFLKQLAINSLKYSAMSAAEKDTALKLWERKWDTFIQEIILENPSASTDQSQETTTMDKFQITASTTKGGNSGIRTTTMGVELLIASVLSVIVTIAFNVNQ